MRFGFAGHYCEDHAALLFYKIFIEKDYRFKFLFFHYSVYIYQIRINLFSWSQDWLDFTMFNIDVFKKIASLRKKPVGRGDEGLSNKPQNTERRNVKKSRNMLLRTWRQNVMYVWICCIGVCVVTELYLVPPINRHALENHREMLGNRSTIEIKHAFEQTQQQLLAIAGNKVIHAALLSGDVESLQGMDKNLEYAFSDIVSLQIIPWDRLGTAGLNKRGEDIRNSIEMMMISTAAAKGNPSPEVYKAGKEWFIIFAVPILHKNEAIGVLLLRLDKQYLARIINQQYYTDTAQLTVKHKGQGFIIKYGNSEGPTVIDSYRLPFSGGVLEIITDEIQSREIGLTFYFIYAMVFILAVLLTFFSFLAYLGSKRIISKDCDSIMGYMQYIKPDVEMEKPVILVNDLMPVLFKVDELVARLDADPIA